MADHTEQYDKCMELIAAATKDGLSAICVDGVSPITIGRLQSEGYAVIEVPAAPDNRAVSIIWA
jgi:hypothetical protein